MGKRPKGTEREETIVESKPQLAEALGRGVRQITEYLQRGMPRRKDGYCVEECVRWISENIKPTGRGSDSPIGGEECDPTERAEWETRLVKEKALIEELKRKQLAGELIEVEIVARHSERRIAHAKALMEQVPDRVLASLPKLTVKQRKDARSRLRKMIEDVLFALADREAGEDEDGSGDE